MRLQRLVVMLLAIGLWAVIPAAAQERFGGLTGVVTDQQGGALPGATITTTNNDTGTVRTTVSDENGRFNIDALEPGRYSVIVELSGFQKLEANNVIVLLGRNAELPAQLRLGTVSETVQVVGDTARQIDTRSTAITHNITSEEFNRMPKPRRPLRPLRRGDRQPGAARRRTAGEWRQRCRELVHG